MNVAECVTQTYQDPDTGMPRHRDDWVPLQWSPLMPPEVPEDI